MIEFKSNVRQTIANKPNTVTAFDLTGTAPSGFRTVIAAYADTKQLPYNATNGTDWESGIGTVSAGLPNTLVRTVVLESSNADAAVDFSAGADIELFVEWPAKIGHSSALLPITPGGRLTLESGVPVSTTDQLAKTTLYYTPYIHNTIHLWDGFRWQAVEFSETSIALGAMTALLPYDIYAYITGGTLALELVAWTNATTRAVNVTLQDGRYCKSVDKTRLLLGTIAAKTTTTCEDSLRFRLVANIYNRVNRFMRYVAGSSSHTWTPGVNSLREYNGTSGVAIARFVNSIPVSLPCGCFAVLTSSVANSSVSVLANLDSAATVYPTASGQPPGVFSSFTTSNNYSSFGEYNDIAPGLHIITLCERIVSGSTQTLTADYGSFWGDILS